MTNDELLIIAQKNVDNCRAKIQDPQRTTPSPFLERCLEYTEAVVSAAKKARDMEACREAVRNRREVHL